MRTDIRRLIISTRKFSIRAMREKVKTSIPEGKLSHDLHL